MKKITVHLVPYLHLEIIKNFFHLYLDSTLFFSSLLWSSRLVFPSCCTFFFAFFFTISRYSGHTFCLLYIFWYVKWQEVLSRNGELLFIYFILILISSVCWYVFKMIYWSRFWIMFRFFLLVSFVLFGNFYRYKRLLCTVDLTKDFFFSYSNHIMHSLQRNLSDNVEGQTYYESMFVWNEYLTRLIRNNAEDCMWTVALVYGFFKQVLLFTNWSYGFYNFF